MNPDLGTPADMKTPLGAHDGYVVGQCLVLGQLRVFVRGTGTERILPLDVRRWEPLAMERLRKLGYAGHSRGFGQGCEGGGMIVTIESWKKMDWAIATTGEALRDANVSDVVTLEVGSIAVLL